MFFCILFRGAEGGIYRNKRCLLSFAYPKESNKEKGTRGEQPALHLRKLKILNSPRHCMPGFKQPNFLNACLMLRLFGCSPKGTK